MAAFANAPRTIGATSPETGAAATRKRAAAAGATPDAERELGSGATSSCTLHAIAESGAKTHIHVPKTSRIMTADC
jgi:hypothetical protein